MSQHSTSVSSPRQDVATLLWQLIKTELTPYPIRYVTALRMTIACTLAMVILMVFRVPGAALGAYFPFLMPRDSFRSTWRTVSITIITCLLGTAQILLGATFFAASPLAHFFWSIGSMFVVFYCISIMTVTNATVGLGLLTAGGIGIWDMTASASNRVTLTLYLLLSVLIGCAVTAIVEFVFSRSRQPNVILEGIRTRVMLVRQLLQTFVAGEQPSQLQRHYLAQYARRGTGQLGDVLLGADYDDVYRSQLATALALSHELVHLAATIAEEKQQPSPEDRLRLQTLIARLTQIEEHLKQSQAPDRIELPDTFPISRTFPEIGGLERTIDLLADAFAEGGTNFATGSSPVHHHAPVFVEDAFQSNRHLRFATRGTLSAMLCYILYLSSGWKGLNASIVTCFLTALISVGVTRQRQLLRLLGVFAGGCILGIGSQMLLLPWIETLSEFSIVFAGCIFICAWVATSGPRLAFAGAQMALAYDLVNLNRFGINTSLVPTRDALLGIVMGLAAMWLIYDHLWAMPSATAQKRTFVMILRSLASTATISSTASLSHERSRIGRAFEDLRAFADSQIFEPHVADESEELVAQCVEKWQSSVSSLSLIQFGLLEHIADHGMQSSVTQEALQQTSEALEAIASMLGRKPMTFCPENLTRLLHSIEQLQTSQPLSSLLTVELRLGHSLIVLIKEVAEQAAADVQSLVDIPQATSNHQEFGL